MLGFVCLTGAYLSINKKKMNNNWIKFGIFAGLTAVFALASFKTGSELVCSFSDAVQNVQGVLVHIKSDLGIQSRLLSIDISSEESKTLVRQVAYQYSLELKDAELITKYSILTQWNIPFIDLHPSSSYLISQESVELTHENVRSQLPSPPRD